MFPAVIATSLETSLYVSMYAYTLHKINCFSVARVIFGGFFLGAENWTLGRSIYDRRKL
jgi:hypothetical protein